LEAFSEHPFPPIRGGIRLHYQLAGKNALYEQAAYTTRSNSRSHIFFDRRFSDTDC